MNTLWTWPWSTRFSVLILGAISVSILLNLVGASLFSLAGADYPSWLAAAVAILVGGTAGWHSVGYDGDDND